MKERGMEKIEIPYEPHRRSLISLDEATAIHAYHMELPRARKAARG
jgi:hypothetical protein